ncbi:MULTISPECIES: response regulator transcription factor [unclassified Lysobacter]|uniref:response regulator n=1 Tax=unclassified Lysobacter TaxID=2635362 RepID=UPI001BEBC2CC|nr:MULTISPECIES: response regulator transcription factor [unclassified Lysobacter]MBT2747534.1 response regulator transcription factor [Lysobacter sp. ISL-42]MBT2752357.1 response regulator transcription factor [Lysobacter sp. ISL-50]MBT2776224.1 response regulator transcription factor [Lysobacter sp. ISL-54]MBT2784308.1 response regulator transcription factor [Lysobacter sp. ISL-52]
MIRLFVIDDHPLVRIGMTWVLETQKDFRVVGEAANGKDALVAIARRRVDVVLCDFHLPDMDGLEVTRRLLAEHPDLKVLIVSVVEGGPVPRRLLAAGAMGYVSKARDGSAVIRAVREVAAGRRYLDDTLGARVLFETTPFDQLSPRQLEVALLMVHGRRNAEIALELDLTESTIRTVRAKVMAKLGVRGEIALARLAMDCGLIPPAGKASSCGSYRDG